MTESWLHLTVHISTVCLDAVANFLIERGSSGVVFRHRAVEAYFPHNRNADALKRAVHRFVFDVVKLQRRSSRPRLSWQITRPENWQNAWKRFIRPSRVGRRLWVTPPWLTPPKFRSRHIIVIEPGMAFGTGTHATTRGCLEFIELVAALSGSGFSALDIGTGSGILAIALVKLGATKVWAIDNDPVALAVARENLSINDVDSKVHLSGAALGRLNNNKFPVVVANLTAETIMELAVTVKRRVAPGGYLILSGILNNKAAAVLRCFAPRFVLVKRKRAREWATLLLQRR